MSWAPPQERITQQNCQTITQPQKRYLKHCKTIGVQNNIPTPKGAFQVSSAKKQPYGISLNLQCIMNHMVYFDYMVSSIECHILYHAISLPMQGAHHATWCNGENTCFTALLSWLASGQLLGALGHLSECIVLAIAFVSSWCVCLNHSWLRTLMLMINIYLSTCAKYCLYKTK